MKRPPHSDEESGRADAEVESALAAAATADDAGVERAAAAPRPGLQDLAVLLSSAAGARLEALAQRARGLTMRHFGHTVSLYAPLYLSNYCSGGCAYCGFASDRPQVRRRLTAEELSREIEALRAAGLDDVLLLTGDRVPEAGFDYLLDCVSLAARLLDRVTVESFAMTTDEYRRLADAGCDGITLYQETYDAGAYDGLHRWGPKRDFRFRLEAPARALSAGLRTVGVGVLLGLADPRRDALRLFRHADSLRREFWQGGMTVSFPRLRPQKGDFRARHPVEDRQMAQIICAFRIALPEVPLVLSTRETPAFRDGMAGIGITRMSVASRTSVGGYSHGVPSTERQFEVRDHRGVDEFRRALRAKGLDPVFKSWDRVFNLGGTGTASAARGRDGERSASRAA